MQEIHLSRTTIAGIAILLVLLAVLVMLATGQVGISEAALAISTLTSALAAAGLRLAQDAPMRVPPPAARPSDAEPLDESDLP